MNTPNKQKLTDQAKHLMANIGEYNPSQNELDAVVKTFQEVQHNARCEAVLGCMTVCMDNDDVQMLNQFLEDMKKEYREGSGR